MKKISVLMILLMAFSTSVFAELTVDEEDYLKTLIQYAKVKAELKIRIEEKSALINQAISDIQDAKDTEIKLLEKAVSDYEKVLSPLA